jgi:acetyl esterase/lipase
MHTSTSAAKRRAYDDDALHRLLQVQDRLTVNGVDVHLRRATETERAGLLDPWLLKRTEELAARPAVGPKPGIGTLFSMLFRPETFLVSLRERAEKFTMSPNAGSSIDLTESPVRVTSERLTLWKEPNTLWKYEKVDAEAGRRPAFLHLHAGGFFVGRPTGDDSFLKFVAERSGAVVFDLDYSLSPEHRFPHAVNEALAAARHLRDHADEYGIDPARIVIGGGSAGGNLTAAVAVKARADDPTLLALQVLMNPALGMGQTTPTGFRWNATDFVVDESVRRLVGRIADPRKDRAMRTMFNAYRGNESGDHPLLSPWLADDLTGLPPALVTTAEMDALRSEGEFYVGQLASAGVPVKAIRYLGVKHESGGMFGYIPQAEAVALEVVMAIADLAARQATGETRTSTVPNEEEER